MSQQNDFTNVHLVNMPEGVAYAGVTEIKPTDDGYRLVLGPDARLHIIDRDGLFGGTYDDKPLYTLARLTRCNEVYAGNVLPYPYAIAESDSFCEICGDPSEFEHIQTRWTKRAEYDLDHLVSPYHNGQPPIVQAAHDVKLGMALTALSMGVGIGVGIMGDHDTVIGGIPVRIVLR